jgi:hypothetical protein
MEEALRDEIDRERATEENDIASKAPDGRRTAPAYFVGAVPHTKVVAIEFCVKSG